MKDNRQFVISEKDFAEAQKILSSKSEDKVYRVYVGGTFDGFGDFLHLLNRAKANMQLPKSFREEFPEIYIIDINYDHDILETVTPEAVRDKKNAIIKMMEDLPEGHPLHYNNHNRNIFFLDENPNLEDLRKKSKVIYSVSTNFLGNGKNISDNEIKITNPKDIIISNREFSVYPSLSQNSLHSLTNRDFGFSSLGCGIFAETNPKISDEEILDIFNQANPDEKGLLCKIFQTNKYPITQKDLESFRNKFVLLPAYADKQPRELLEIIKQSLIGSKVLAKKKLVVFTGGVDEMDNNQFRTINKGNVFLSDKLYKALRAFGSSDVEVFSGDNGFQNAINSERLPIGRNYKPYHIGDFKAFIDLCDNKELTRQEKKDLLSYFSALEKGKIGSEIVTKTLIKSWKKLCGIIKSRFNYFDVTNKMELQSLALRHFMTSENPNIELLKLFTPEEKLCLLYEMYTQVLPSPNDNKKIINLFANLGKGQLLEIAAAIAMPRKNLVPSERYFLELISSAIEVVKNVDDPLQITAILDQHFSASSSQNNNCSESIKRGLINNIHILLKGGVNPNFIDKKGGVAPLFVALVDYNIRLAELLLIYGADPLIENSDKRIHNPFICTLEMIAKHKQDNVIRNCYQDIAMVMAEKITVQDFVINFIKAKKIIADKNASLPDELFSECFKKISSPEKSSEFTSTISQLSEKDLTIIMPYLKIPSTSPALNGVSKSEHNQETVKSFLEYIRRNSGVNSTTSQM